MAEEILGQAIKGGATKVLISTKGTFSRGARGERCRLVAAAFDGENRGQTPAKTAIDSP